MKKAVVGVFVLLLVGLIGYRLNARRETSAQVEARSQQVLLPSVTTALAEVRPLTPRVVLTGNIRPENEVEVGAKGSGRVVAIKAEVGDAVKAGQVLAMLEQAIPLQQLKQANAALEAARAGLMNAERGSQSAEALARDSNIAENQLVGARAGLMAARAQVKQAEAAVAMAREALANTRITSPIEGIVTRRSISLGVMVSPGGGMGPMGGPAAAFQVQNRRRMKLESSVDERELAFVKVGMPVEFEVSAWPGERFRGQVRLVAPTLDPVSRRIPIEISIDNPDDRLYANMFAQGELRPQEVRQVLSVPIPVVVRTQDEAVVFVLEGDRVSRRGVKTGESDGEYIAILSGVQAGERVVASGMSRLSDGVQVDATAAPAPAPDAAAARQAPESSAPTAGGAL